jgi:hypothetical protein
MRITTGLLSTLMFVMAVPILSLGKGFPKLKEADSLWTLHQLEKSDARRESARLGHGRGAEPAFKINVSLLRGLTQANFVQYVNPAKVRTPHRFDLLGWERTLLVDRDLLFVPSPRAIPTPLHEPEMAEVEKEILLALRPLRMRLR